MRLKRRLKTNQLAGTMLTKTQDSSMVAIRDKVGFLHVKKQRGVTQW